MPDATKEPAHEPGASTTANTGANAPKTLDAYAEDRAKLAVLKAPAKFAFSTAGIDLEYRRDQKVEYLLGMVGHLLKRVEALETELAAKNPRV